MTMKHQSFYKIFGFVIAILLSSEPCFGWNDALNRTLHKLDAGGKNVIVHSFGINQTNKPAKDLKLGVINFQEAVNRIVRNRSNSAFIGIETTRSNSFSLHGHLSESLTTTFSFQGIKFCDFEVKSHRTPNNELLVLGNAPQIQYNSIYPWPTKDSVANNVETYIYSTIFNADRINILRYDACYIPLNGEAQPVYKMHVMIDNMPYTVVANHQQVFRMNAAFFDATGYAKIYPNNTLGNTQKQYTLEGLSGDGTLTGTYFKTVVNNKDYTRAHNSDHKFFYDKTDLEYGEVATYTHANIHLNFFEDLGYVWNGPKPIQVYVHEAPNNNTNNALYMPAGADGPYPKIIIGDGDGMGLQNLTFDGDVVSHEFGHHIIYQTVKTTAGESIVVHEGLADYFTFARTDDPCLGDSICPEGSLMCWSSGKKLCLRTANNNLAYKDDLWNQLETDKNKLTHHHSQMLSGYLWDLREREGIPPTDVTKLAYRAVSLLRNSSGIQDFLLGMLHADKELFDSKYFDTIVSAASNKRRGMASLLKGVIDPSSIPLPSGESSLTQEPSVTTSRSKSSSKGPFSCGTITGSPVDGLEALFVVLALLLPVWFVRCPAPAPVKHTHVRRRSR